MEKFALTPAVSRIRGGQREQRAIGKCNGFFDKPAVAAHRNEIAGHKRRDGHARWKASGVPTGFRVLGAWFLGASEPSTQRPEPRTQNQELRTPKDRHRGPQMRFR